MPPRPKGSDLNAREARFCAEYLIDANGTQAAIRAGYAPKAAGQQAADILKRPRVREYLEKLGAEQKKRLEVTADRILQEIAKVGLADPSRYLIVGEDGELRADFSRMTPYDLAAVSSVEFEFPKVSAAAKKAKAGKGRRSGPATKVDLPIARVSRIKTWDKMAALNMLGRSQGVFSDLPPPPPDPNKDVKRQTIINVLVQNLNGRASQVHAQVKEISTTARDISQGKMSTGLGPATQKLIDARRAQKK